MPRQKRANIYKRGETWWCRCTVAGHEHRRSLHTSDERIAARRAEEWRETLIAANHFGERRPTWADAFVAWSKHIVSHVAPATATRYAVSLGQLEPYLAGLYVDQIDKRLVSDIVAGRRAQGCTTATIRRDLVALSSVLSFCEDEYDLQGNAAKARLAKLREKREPIVLPVAADVERVIARAPGALSAMTRVAWLTGCRQDELVTAERRNIDWQRAQLTIVGKGRKLRVVPLSAEALEALRSVPVHLHSPLVFHHSGEPYRNLASQFRQIVLSAQKTHKGFRPFRFHDLRHLFAVEELKRGRSIYALQQIMGHSSVKVTEGYLAYLTPEEAERTKSGTHIEVSAQGNRRN